MLFLGIYPEVSLKKARGKLAIARTQSGDGKDPSSIRKQVTQFISL